MIREQGRGAPTINGEPRTDEFATPGPGDAFDASGALYPPQGNVKTLWSIDFRRWDVEPDYRAACEEFISSRIWGASLETARVGQDDAGSLILFAESWLDSDGGFRRDPVTLRPMTAGVVVPLPDDVELPR
jgi:hypothetical protein